MLLARVAIPVPLGQTFTYGVGPERELKALPGARVVCAFGKRRVVGVVLDVCDGEPTFPIEKLKPLGPCIDAHPVLPQELLAFLLELGRYYLAPLGDVMRLALPAVERTLDTQQTLKGTGSKIVGRLTQRARAVAGAVSPKPLRGHAPAILAHLTAEGPASVAWLTSQWSSARSVLRRLESLGLVQLETSSELADPYFASSVERDHPPVLNQAQKAAVEAIGSSLTSRFPQAFLLQGVTASGKTEVYLHTVEQCLALGRGALVLVPEIALTPQLVARFRARLGDAIAVVHSALGEVERQRMWQGLRQGTLRVAVGARSALFAPVERLGLVCVDEEHDSSFKQEEGVRYNARDMALLRAHLAGASCVLGSATPSLGSEYAAREGKLHRLLLPGRALSGASLPDVELVDLRRMGPGPSGDRLLTVPLLSAIEDVLLRRQQAILFLNRRGFAPSLVCDACGQVVRCPDCSVALTLHRARRPELVCHYCDYTVVPMTACPACKADKLTEEGAGTERIEQSLETLFPQARIARLDRDVAAGPKSEKVMDRMRRGEIDVLVGTQMVTKGHDLPRVTLVGVLDADASLSLPDFRAAERTFQLLVQVAGRAGRADARGRVLIQTRQPEAPAVSFAVHHDVDAFLAHELKERRELSYPPYARLGLVRCEALSETCAEKECERLARLARSVAPGQVHIVGPAPAPVSKIRSRYRFRFLVRSSDRRALRAVLLQVLRAPRDKRLRLMVDVDPMNML